MNDIEPVRTGDPAAAFDQMRGELALLRRAIEGLTAEKEKAPDYSETLGKMEGRLQRIAHNIVHIAEQPAMKLTPESMAERIGAAVLTARETDRATIKQAQDLHHQTHADQMCVVGAIRTRREQHWHLFYTGIGTALAVSLLWLVYPGWAASIGPQSWHWPERVARSTMGEASLWDAGIRLMRAGNPQGWQAIVDAADMRQANRDTIAACERAAIKAKKPVKCTVRIGDPQP